MNLTINLTTLRRGNRQKGMALIFAIGFLAVLSILGAIVLNVATRDLTGAGGASSIMPKHSQMPQRARNSVSSQKATSAFWPNAEA